MAQNKLTSRPRIVWEEYPNQNIRYMNVDVELWDSIYTQAFNKTLTPEQKELMFWLESISGVVSLSFDKYAIRVKKGVVFDWEEIAPKVESVFVQWVRGEE